MEFTFKSKFDLEEVVWFMYENKPVQGIVSAINYQRIESVDTAGEHKNIFHKIKSFIDKKKVDVRLIYELAMVKSDGTFISCTHYKRENEIFKTKEELIKSL
ncbi:MAG: hypothetical protein J6U90_03900 [Methanobrevibacter sp.]|nr:hypothetical protein [Methanobrevibacter sp.]